MISSIKGKLSSFTTKTMVNYCKGCDAHMFVVEEIIEAVSSIVKGCQKLKIKWVFELNVWSIAY